jgi:hypothetical protein
MALMAGVGDDDGCCCRCLGTSMEQQAGTDQTATLHRTSVGQHVSTTTYAYGGFIQQKL